MRNSRILSDADMLEIANRYRAGESITNIAKSYHIDTRRVYAAFQLHGVTVRKHRRNKPLPRETVLEICKRRDGGQLFREIAQALNLSITCANKNYYLAKCQGLA